MLCEPCRPPDVYNFHFQFPSHGRLCLQSNKVSHDGRICFISRSMYAWSQWHSYLTSGVGLKDVLLFSQEQMLSYRSGGIVLQGSCLTMKPHLKMVRGVGAVMVYVTASLRGYIALSELNLHTVIMVFFLSGLQVLLLRLHVPLLDLIQKHAIENPRPWHSYSDVLKPNPGMSYFFFHTHSYTTVWQW